MHYLLYFYCIYSGILNVVMFHSSIFAHAIICHPEYLLHFILLCMYNLLIARQQLLVRFVDVSTTFVIALMKCFLYLTEFKCEK